MNAWSLDSTGIDDIDIAEKLHTRELQRGPWIEDECTFEFRIRSWSFDLV